ncbi:carbohydrate sulfotransferase 11-like [Diadema setosum]|uniref:carbohydrate sulfotransferase 11-like n=1 Tax=Diadema setosum TaxID=31175 RepID=UPI003B3AE466
MLPCQGVFTSDYHQKTQERRKGRIDHVCRLLGPFNRSEFLSDRSQRKRLHHIFVIPEFNVVFCSVPKVSCTNWKRLFSVISGHIQNYGQIGDPHRFFRQHFRRLSSLGADDIARVLDTHTTFMFARNPYTRLLSAFMEKIEYQPGGRLPHQIYRWLLRNRPEIVTPNTSDLLTFDQFLTFYTDSVMEKNEHWQDMHELCFPCHIKYDFVGRYETLKPDADYFMRFIGAPSNNEFPDPHKKPTYSSDRKTLLLKYSSVSDSQLQHLSQNPGLAVDLMLFGYSIPKCIQWQRKKSL